MMEDTFFDFWSNYRNERNREDLLSFPESFASIPAVHSVSIEEVQEDSFLKQDEEIVASESEVRLTKEEIKQAGKKTPRRVLEYENWIGRILDLEPDIISARLINTLNRYSPRVVHIQRSYFVAKGVTQELFNGDEFEISFQSVRNGKGPIHHEECIRMIHHVNLDKAEIDRYVEEQFRDLKIVINGYKGERL